MSDLDNSADHLPKRSLSFPVNFSSLFVGLFCLYYLSNHHTCHVHLRKIIVSFGYSSNPFVFFVLEPHLVPSSVLRDYVITLTRTYENRSLPFVLLPFLFSPLMPPYTSLIPFKYLSSRPCTIVYHVSRWKENM